MRAVDFSTNIARTRMRKGVPALCLWEGVPLARPQAALATERARTAKGGGDFDSFQFLVKKTPECIDTVPYSEVISPRFSTPVCLSSPSKTCSLWSQLLWDFYFCQLANGCSFAYSRQHSYPIFKLLFFLTETASDISSSSSSSSSSGHPPISTSFTLIILAAGQSSRPSQDISVVCLNQK